MACRFCQATGRDGCISCGSEPAPRAGLPEPLLVLSSPPGSEDGRREKLVMRYAFGREAIAASALPVGFDMAALNHRLADAKALLLDGETPPPPPRPLGARMADMEAAMSAAIPEAEVPPVVEMVMLEVECTPVVPREGASLADAVAAAALPDGRYAVADPAFPDPVDAAEVQRMRARWLIGKDRFVQRTGIWPRKWPERQPDGSAGGWPHDGPVTA